MNKAKEAAKQIWGASPAGIRYGKGYEPGTKEFFENVLAKRSTYELPWLFDLIPFSSFQGKKVLEIGCGVGTDLASFAKAGAIVTGADLTLRSVDLSAKQFELYGLKGEFLVADAENLPFSNETFDIILFFRSTSSYTEYTKSYLRDSSGSETRRRGHHYAL